MSPGRRKPQLALRLEAGIPDAAERWHEGARLAYLGGTLTITLASAHGEARRDGASLALPLPPQATPRQIQDRAEAWLRDEASRLLHHVVGQKSALAGRRPPRLVLSFAAKGHWVEARDRETLRCNWRLVEQSLPVIEQAIGRALASLPGEAPSCDLFGASPAL